MLRVDRERYMKYVVTELNNPNEPVMFSKSILGNYSFDVYATETYFGECPPKTIEEILTNKQLEERINHPHSPTDELSCTIVDDRINFINNSSIDVALDYTFGHSILIALTALKVKTLETFSSTRKRTNI